MSSFKTFLSMALLALFFDFCINCHGRDRILGLAGTTEHRRQLRRHSHSETVRSDPSRSKLDEAGETLDI